MSMSMSVDLYSANREAPNALCTLLEREKKSFQNTTKTVNRTRRISELYVNNNLLCNVVFSKFHSVTECCLSVRILMCSSRPTL